MSSVIMQIERGINCLWTYNLKYNKLIEIINDNWMLQILKIPLSLHNL